MKVITELMLQDKIRFPSKYSHAKFILKLAKAQDKRLKGQYDYSRMIIKSFEVTLKDKEE